MGNENSKKQSGKNNGNISNGNNNGMNTTVALTFDMLERITMYIADTRTYFTVLLLNSRIRKYLINNLKNNNIVFSIKRTVNHRIKIVYNYVTKLKVFISYSDDFDEKFFKFFPNLQCLEVVLNGNLIGDRQFTKLSCLKELRLIKCPNVTDVVFGFISKGLQSLTISGGDLIRGKGIENLALSLVELSILDNDNIQDDVFVHLVNLEKILLCNCKLVTNNFLSNCKKIRVLNLSRMVKLDSKLFDNNKPSITLIECIFLDLLDYCNAHLMNDSMQALKSIGISKCKVFNNPFPATTLDLSIVKSDLINNSCFMFIRNLRSLTIDSNTSLDDDLFKHNFNSWKSLRKLSLRNVNEKLFGKNFSTGLINLTHLSVENTEDLDDNKISGFLSLVSLSLNKCFMVKGLVFEKFKCLRKVELIDCDNISGEIFGELHKRQLIGFH